MKSLDIKQLIGEATEYDKKLSLEAKKPKSWCKSVSAFANTLGGALIFGIADNDEIVGLENPNSDAEKISEIIKTRMDPVPEFRLRFEQVEDGKVLIILDIFKGEETPYYYSGDGVLEAYASFPFRNRFVTHIQFFCQLLLRQSKSFSFFCNIFSDFD